MKVAVEAADQETPSSLEYWTERVYTPTSARLLEDANEMTGLEEFAIIINEELGPPVTDFNLYISVRESQAAQVAQVNENVIC